MESRWMRRKNDNGEEEKFYPITHVDAIIGLSLDDNENNLLDTVNNHLNDTNNPHKLDAEDVGALPGNGGYALYEGNNNEAKIEARNIPESDANRRVLRVKTSIGRANIKDALLLDDVIDGVRTEYSVFGTHNPPTAEQMGGVTRHDTYIEGSIATFLGTLSDFNSGFVTYSDVTDGPSGMNSGSLFYLKIQTFSSRIMLFAFHDGDFASGIYDKGTITWGKTLKNYLPLTGGTLSGNLLTGNGYGGIASTSTTNLLLGSLNEPNNLSNGRFLELRNTANVSAPELSKAIGLTTVTDGTWKTYNLYGEHNKPTPEEIGAASSSHTHNYAGSLSAGGSANSANKLLSHEMGNVMYVSGDTHILKLGYWKCTNTFDNLNLLISSSFWGNQHGSADIITLRQDLNDNSSGTVKCTLSRTCLMRYSPDREFYYIIDNTNRRVYLYVSVYGGNSYGKWSVSVLQNTNDNWISECAANQTISNQTLINETYLNIALTTSTPSSLNNGDCAFVYA